MQHITNQIENTTAYFDELGFFKQQHLIFLSLRLIETLERHLTFRYTTRLTIPIMSSFGNNAIMDILHIMTYYILLFLNELPLYLTVLLHIYPKLSGSCVLCILL